MLRISILSLSISFVFISCGHDAKVEALIKKTNENMVFVKGGTFMMGDVGGIFMGKDYKRFNTDPKYDPHEETVNDFYIHKYEVTFGDYKIFAEEKGLPIKYQHEDNRAASAHSWQAAKDYCLWLGEHSAKNYDLPTEFQWEYAARNRGQRVLFATDDSSAVLGKNIPRDFGEIARYKPNPLGLYDMTSNSTEWTDSWYSEMPPHQLDKSIIKHSSLIKVSKGQMMPSTPTFKTIHSAKTNYVRLKGYINADYIGFRCVINPE